MAVAQSPLGVGLGSCRGHTNLRLPSLSGLRVAVGHQRLGTGMHCCAGEGGGGAGAAVRPRATVGSGASRCHRVSPCRCGSRCLLQVLVLPRVPVLPCVPVLAAGPGAAVGPSAPRTHVGCLSWGKVEFRQGLCPYGLTQLLLKNRSASQFQIPVLW